MTAVWHVNHCPKGSGEKWWRRTEEQERKETCQGGKKSVKTDGGEERRRKDGGKIKFKSSVRMKLEALLLFLRIILSC